jgi:hypothetical protein
MCENEMKQKIWPKLAGQSAIAAEKKAALAQPQLSASDVFDRLKVAADCETDGALERAIGFSHGKITDGRKVNRVPYRAAVFIAVQHSISLDWILLGRGNAKSTG